MIRAILECNGMRVKSLFTIGPTESGSASRYKNIVGNLQNITTMPSILLPTARPYARRNAAQVLFRGTSIGRRPFVPVTSHVSAGSPGRSDLEKLCDASTVNPPTLNLTAGYADSSVYRVVGVPPQIIRSSATRAAVGRGPTESGEMRTRWRVSQPAWSIAGECAPCNGGRDSLFDCAIVASFRSGKPIKRAEEIVTMRLTKSGSEIRRRPNGSRLSCGALKKNTFPNLRAPPASSAC